MGGGIWVDLKLDLVQAFQETEPNKLFLLFSQEIRTKTFGQLKQRVACWAAGTEWPEASKS